MEKRCCEKRAAQISTTFFSQSPVEIDRRETKGLPTFGNQKCFNPAHKMVASICSIATAPE
jgi:hypothetical protein